MVEGIEGKGSGALIARPAMEALETRGFRLVAWERGDPFKEHPQLASIWPEPFARFAREGVAETIDLGGLYLVEEGGRPMGITGFFTEKDAPGIVYLRWHGIEEGFRGNGLSGAILAAVVERAALSHPQAEVLVEMAPLCPYGESIERHFKHVGFETWGAPEFLDWSGMSWQPYGLWIKPFMANIMGKGDGENEAKNKVETSPRRSF